MRASRITNLSIRIAMNLEEWLMQTSGVTGKRDVVGVAISDIDADAWVESARVGTERGKEVGSERVAG